MNKRAGRAELRANHIAIAVAAAFGPWSAYGQTPPPANQLPNLTVTQGLGQVNAPVGNFLQVDQYSQRAIFSGSMTMGSAGHMNVSQPASSSIGLFRDVSGSLTQIFGRITANGQIFISNQNGVLFGSTARVEVGGLFASSLSINDTDFMEGRYNWYNDGSAGSVTNQGTIITPSGYTVLAGPQVRNDGLIVARTGTVVLAAGDRVALDLIGDGLISVSVDQAALNASAVNTGAIEAEGGKVVLTARSANALLDTVVNAGGVIRASSLVERNGEIILDGGTSGTTQITGTVDARNVTVRGATISQAPSAAIIADTLTTESTGNTTLTGTNQVGRFTGSSSTGSLTLIDGGALEVQGATTNNGLITLTTDSLTNAGLISNGGGASTANVILSADAFDLAGGTVQGGAAAVIVRPRTGTRSFGIEAAGDTTLTNADIASINTSNFVVFGSGTGTIFTGNMTIGQNAQVDGGTKNLAFFRSSAPGGTTTIGSQGVTTTGDAIVSAGGGAIVSNGGTVAGDEIQLRASQGIGSAAARVRTNANALAINNTGGPGAFVSEGGDVTLRNVNLLVGGIANNVSNVVGGAGAYDVAAAGAISVGGLIATTNGAITLTTSSLANNSALITTNGPANTANIVFNADAFNLAGGTVQAGAGAVILRPRTGSNSLGIEAAGTTTLTNADIASIHTTDFVVFGSGMGTTFTGNMTIGANAQVNGGGKNLAFFRSSTPGGTTTIGPSGLSTTGDVIVSAGGGAIVSNGGTVSADEVQLRASQGIGSAAARVQTNANALAINNTGSQGAFVSEADNVTLRNVNLVVGGIVNNVANSVGAGGAYDVAANGALAVGGPISTLNGAITLNAGSLTNSSLITNGGGSNTANIIFNADAFNLADGKIEGGAGAVVLRPRTGTNSFGIEAAGATTLTNADIASINTSNFVIFGSSTGTIFTGNMTIGENARVEGNGRNLAFSRSLTPSAEMITIGSQGVATTGDIIMGAGGGGIRSNGGTVTGDEVVLRASNGIGTPSARVKTAANALALNNVGGGGVFVSELDNVTLRTISLNAGGPFTVSNTNNGSFSLISGGDVNVAGLVSAAGSMIVDAGGNLKLDATAVDAQLTSVGGQTLSAQSIEMTALNGRRASIQNQGGLQELTARSGGMTLQAPTGSGQASIVNIASPVFPANQTINVAGELSILGGATGGFTNSGIFQNGVGLQTVRAAGITLQGASTGVNAGAGIRSQGDQFVEVSGDINMRGGNGGTNNNAFLSANPTTPGVAGRQTIRARDINLSNGVGGVDTTATITAGIQDIQATGNVTMTSQGALLGAAPGGPGVRIGAVGNTPLATNLTLRVGGNLVLNGGAAENGASIGSSAATIPLTANNISIDAGGSVIMNAGNAPNSGVRIGSGSSGTAGGNITILAGGNIELNGTQRSAAIRTLDTVTLDAANISQAGLGTIIAGTLNTRSSGSTLLTGMDAAFNINNVVSNFNGVSGGDLSFFNRGPLTVTGVNAAGDASLVNALADLNLTGQWTSSTASIFSGAAIVESGAGAIQAASLVADAPLGLNLAGANRVGVLDAKTSGVLTFNNAAALEVARASASNGANLISAGTMTISGQVISSSGISLTANGGSIVETGTGSITAGFGSLTTFSTGDTALNSSANQISSFNATSGGDVSLVTNGSLTVTGMNAAGNASITDFGNISIGGASWTAGGTSSITAGDIVLSTTLSSSSVVLNSGAGQITESGAGAIFANSLSTTSGGSTTLSGPNVVASYAGQSGSSLTFNNNGALAISGLDSAGNASVTSFGDLTVTGAWRSASADLRANGFGSAIRETGDGAIQTGSLTTFSEGATSLSGANQVASLNAATSFGGTSGISFNNSGALTVTALSTGGNATLTNDGAVNVSGAWSSTGATTVATTGGDLTVTNSLISSGPMVLDVGGTLRVVAGGTQSATLQSSGGQDIAAGAIEVSARDGRTAFVQNLAGDQTISATSGGLDVLSTGTGSIAAINNNGLRQALDVTGGVRMLGQGSGTFAQIANFGAREQSISVAGGNGMDLTSNGGNTTITQITPGSSQTIRVTDADHINLNGISGFASMSANGGTQTVSITGSGRNAITLGSAGALGASNLGATTQTVTAGAAGEQGSITIIGSNTNGRFAGMSTQPSTGGTQSVSTSGLLRVTGGNAPGQNLNAGLFHAGSGAQTVNAARIELEGGAGGNFNGALIVSNGGNVPANAGAQNISVSGDITIAGGPGGNAGILGSSTRQQTIFADNIHITNSAGGGINSVGFIQGGHQEIHAAGDMTLTAKASGGDLPGVRVGGNASNPTDLKLFVGGDLVLSGGTAVNNGVGIGSTASVGGLANNIHIEAGGSVILNSGTLAGTGARIGSPVAGTGPGNIEIHAGGAIELNGVAQGTAIRTLGNVTLDAASISEAANGFIVANTLTTTTTGNTNLAGPNTVSRFNGTSGADLSFNNGGPLDVMGVSAAGNASITNNGAVTLSGAWTSASASISANGDVSEAPGGFIQAGSLSVFSGGAASLTGPNQVSTYSGETGGDLILNNSGALDVGNLSVGGDATLTNLGSVTLSGTWSSANATITATGVSSTIAEGPTGFMETGTLTANASGDITFGAANRISRLHATTFSGDLVFNNTVALEVAQVDVDGVTFTNAGAVTVNGLWSSSATSITTTGPGADLAVNDRFITAIGPMTIDVSGALAVNATSQNAGLASFGPGATQDITAHSIGLTAQNGFRANIENFGVGQRITASAGDLNLQVPGAFGVTQIVNFGGEQTIEVAGQLNVLGGVISPTPTGFRNSGIFNNVPGGQQNVTAAGITLQGASSGTMAGALIVSQGNQLIDVTGGNINLIGGSGGVSNSATIGASVTGQQTILAHDINLSNGFGATDTVAAIVGGHQTIDATGDVTLTAQGSLVSPGAILPGVRIGAPGASTTGTDLTLRVGGNVVLNGGAVGNGASIGSIGAGAARPNTILIDAGGSVILNSGSAADAGARVGSSVQNGLAGGNITIVADGGIELNGTTAQTAIRTLDTVTLVADHISEAANGFIVAGTLNTTTQGNASLTGPNQVGSFTASSDHGNVHLTNTSALLTLGSMDLPGNLAIVQTGDVAMGNASATQATLVAAAGDISMSASGQLLVRGSDTTSGASGAVLAGGELNFSAGNVALIGGSAAGSFAQITGHGPIGISAGGNVSLTGGSGDGAFARILGYSDINLTVGGFITLAAGSGVDSWARIQTVSRDSVITLNFPNLASGGYFVNGIEGLLRDGHTGFLSDNGVAAPGHQLITIYGAP